jgi:hypothetical protein
VIILKENHTFDCYFGTFPGAEGDSSLAHASDPPTGTFSNNHAAWLARATKAVRKQYHQADIASYWAYAQQFTLCDNFFTDVASDSTPNHLMLIAAASPVINNPSFGSTPSFDLPSLPANLQAAGLTWRNYGGFAFPYVTQLKSSPWNVKSHLYFEDPSLLCQHREVLRREFWRAVDQPARRLGGQHVGLLQLYPSSARCPQVGGSDATMPASKGVSEQAMAFAIFN